MWYFKTHGHLLSRIKWSIARKRSTQGRALWTTQCLFLSLWHKMNVQNILTRRVFSKSSFSWMRDYEVIRNLKLKHCFRDYCCIQTYWLRKKKKNIIINWISGPSPHMPKAQSNIQPKLIFSIISNVGLKDFHHLQ